MPTGNRATTHEQIQQLARLARLELTPEEVRDLRGDLEAILEYAGHLPEIHCAGRLPDDRHSPYQRTDEPGPSLERGQVLDQAPGTRDGYFRVPPAVER